MVNRLATFCWRGLGADNCVEAAQTGCAGLDFNSAVESQPGIKDARLFGLGFPDAARILRKGTMTTLLNPYFGEFGGMYVPQILMPALRQLEEALSVRKKILNFRLSSTTC